MFVLALLAAVAVGVATATAGGGNSANAKLCQHGGWQTLHPATGGGFANEGACVSYAAQGGTPTTASISAYVNRPSDALSEVIAVKGIGFTPNLFIALTETGLGPRGVIFNAFVSADASGAFDSGDGVNLLALYVRCADGPQTIHITATDGVRSASTDVAVSC